MSRYALIALVFLFAAFCLIASAQQTTPPPAAPNAATQQAQSPATPAAPVSNVVVARISGEPITEKQVLAAIQELGNRQISMNPEQQKQRNAHLFKGAMDNIITTIVLKNEAKRLNVTADKAKVDQQMKEFASRYPSQDAFQKAIAAQGFTEAEVRKTVEESLGMQEVINLVMKTAPEVTDAEIQKFYESNPGKFAVPEAAHLAQILLKTGPNSTPEQKEEIRKKLEEIRADIESRKITFTDAVAKFSQDSASAAKGGDIGLLSKTGQLKQIEDFVFATTPGNLTPVIEVQGGFRILQVIEVNPAGQATLEEAKPSIRQYLDQTAKLKAVQKYVEELKSKAVIENFMTAEEFDKRHPAQ